MSAIDMVLITVMVVFLVGGLAILVLPEMILRGRITVSEAILIKVRDEEKLWKWALVTGFPLFTSGVILYLVLFGIPVLDWLGRHRVFP